MLPVGYIFSVSAAGLEPATNGLKGQRPNFAFYDQEPALFHESTGHFKNEALGIILTALSTLFVQWTEEFPKLLDRS